MSMNKFYSISIYSISIITFFALTTSVEAQRVRTVQSIVNGSTYKHAMNACKNGAGGNVIISKDSRKESYYCYHDDNVARSQAEYDNNKIRQQQQQRQQQQSRLRR